MVAGEIGMGPVDEFRSARFIGKGYGSRHAVTHGINGDFALIAETTDFGVTWIEAGAAYFKITLEGRSFYTPRLQSGHGERQPERADKNDPGDRSYRKMGGGIREQIHHRYPMGKMVPKVSIGAIRAGAPYKPSTTPKSCSIYVDVRVPPPVEFIQVERELKEIVGSVGFGGTVECFMARKGYEGKNVEPLVKAIQNAHVAVRGSQPPQVSTPETSMWPRH